jgi:hypothetical protein
MPRTRDRFHDAFLRARPIAMRAAGGRCVKCLVTATEVHHVYGYHDNAAEHLKPLCHPCHNVAPMGEEYWEWERSGPSGAVVVQAYVLAKLRAAYADLSDAEFHALTEQTLAIIARE